MAQPDLYFYNLQRKAPRPVPVLNESSFSESTPDLSPKHYGQVFHGPISRREADDLVRKFGQGAYLVRESVRQRGQYTLVLMFDGEVRNYRLYFDGVHHFLSDKLYNTLEELVADGLICFYCEKHGQHQIERMTMRRKQRHVLGAQDTNSVNSSSTPDLNGSGFVHIPRENVRKSMELLGDEDGTFTASEPIKSKHDFRLTTFFGPHWCAVCNNYMWGLVSQGVKCAQCGLAIHKICQDQVGDYCRPEKKLIKNILGCDLTVICMAFRTQVCFVIKMCTEEIEQREGDQVEGIYRINGGNADVIKIAEEFERNQDRAKIDSTQYPDIHTVSTFFKKYLRALPVPVVSFDIYPELLEVFGEFRTWHLSSKIGKLRRAVEKMDVYHLANLHAIIKHLNGIARQAHANKMTSQNLGTIFGQGLLRNENEDLSRPLQSAYSLNEMPLQNRCVSFMIENYADIFTD